MRIAYIILAHKNPQQLARLVTALQHPKASFFIHIDKKVDLAPFQTQLSTIPSADIRFVKRAKSLWGSIGIVQATLNGLQAVVEAKEHFDYIILLSGLDYPLVSSSSIHRFFENNADKNFIEYFPIDEHTPADWLRRYSHYHFYLMNSLIAYPSAAKSLQRRVMNNVLSLFLPLPRKFPLPLSLYRGSQWWSITRRTAEYIVKFIKDFPAYMNFQQYTFCSDETFFQTIVLNAKDDEISTHIINDNLRQIEWAPSKCHPIIYTHQHFDQLTQSGKLFARKFDLTIDSKIFDMLDKRLSENA